MSGVEATAACEQTTRATYAESAGLSDQQVGHSEGEDFHDTLLSSEVTRQAAPKDERYGRRIDGVTRGDAHGW